VKHEYGCFCGICLDGLLDRDNVVHYAICLARRGLKIREIQGCMILILLVLLLAIFSACYYIIVLHVSSYWKKIMKTSDLILLCVAFVCGCIVTYLVN
jgi:hypothetical protein